MKLYHSTTSPFVRKVTMVLHETGLIDSVELIPSKGTPLDSSGMPVAQNPLGKVPALERADGPAIYDSRVICRYLDDRAQSGLYLDGARLWDVLTIEATADGILEAALAIAYETRLRKPEQQSNEIMDAQWAKAHRAIGTLNTRWISHLSGPHNMGQIATACALGYCDFRMPDRDWRIGNDALALWFDRYSQRESFQATLPVG
ncbi:MAG: glutathione S-transferase [Marinosulfonomonas sp.]